jgi:hypothetical protein
VTGPADGPAGDGRQVSDTQKPSGPKPAAPGATAPPKAKKKRAKAKRRRRLLRATVGLLAAAVVGWVVALVLNNATSSVSLSASNATISGATISFVVVNTGAKAASQCTAYLTFNASEFRQGTRTTFTYGGEPVVPAGGTETFSIAYVQANVLKFAVATVWADCGGSASQHITLLVREPFIDGA